MKKGEIKKPIFAKKETIKKIFTIVLLDAFCMANAQAFKREGDTKLNIVMTLQNGGTGVLASADFGLGENFQSGFSVPIC